MIITRLFYYVRQYLQTFTNVTSQFDLAYRIVRKHYTNLPFANSHYGEKTGQGEKNNAKGRSNDRAARLILARTWTARICPTKHLVFASIGRVKGQEKGDVSIDIPQRLNVYPVTNITALPIPGGSPRTKMHRSKQLYTNATFNGCWRHAVSTYKSWKRYCRIDPTVCVNRKKETKRKKRTRDFRFSFISFFSTFYLRPRREGGDASGVVIFIILDKHSQIVMFIYQSLSFALSLEYSYCVGNYYFPIKTCSGLRVCMYVCVRQWKINKGMLFRRVFQPPDAIDRVTSRKPRRTARPASLPFDRGINIQRS